MHSCREFHSELVQTFLDADLRVCRDAIARDDFDAVQAPMSPRLKAHLAGCSDCQNDVLWLLEIRDEVDVGAFPCIHVAYACSSRANHRLRQQHGMFVLMTEGKSGDGIVIGYCPWCALEVNTSVVRRP